MSRVTEKLCKLGEVQRRCHGARHSRYTEVGVQSEGSKVNRGGSCRRALWLVGIGLFWEKVNKPAQPVASCIENSQVGRE